MINVLHLIDQYRIGGPGKTIINTAKVIDGNIFTIHIGCFLPNMKETEISAEIRQNQIEFLPLIDCRGISIKNFRTLLTYIDEKRISIYHCHGYKADIYGLLLRFLRRNLVIMTTHHGWIKNKFSQSILEWFVLTLSFLFDHTIIVSNEMKRHLPQRTLRKGTYSILHNAIRLGDYKKKKIRDSQRNSLGVKQNEIVLLSVGRLSREKGCKNLLDAFAVVCQRHNNVKLVYVGDGPLMIDLQEQITQYSLSDNVILCGHHQQVQSFYEGADIFVCPSDTEGLSNVILEAMAFSIPVVATAVGGNPEIIAHQTNGLLVPPKNPIVLADAICILISDPNKRIKYGRAGYETVLNGFSFDARTFKIQDLYLKLKKGKDQMNECQ